VAESPEPQPSRQPPGQAPRQARWQAPGRVNLIGEHTDYNAGFVLPFALEQTCTATAVAVQRDTLTLRSSGRPDPVEIASGELRPESADRLGWAAYPAGVVWALRRRGHDVPGLAVELDSAVPTGAGLSSSAALVCAVAAAVDDLLGLRLPAEELLAITRSAENDFVGAPTGGMDQLAALRCEQGHALFCDMRTLEVQQVPFDLDAHRLSMLVVDTRAEHRHSDGEYRQRRAGCERAAASLGVPALRDVTPSGLDDALRRLPDDELRRYTRHVVTENERVLRTVELLRAGEVAAIGPLLDQSHASMRDDYRITIAELDVAADTLVAAGALGARMTGGGFGGCVIALIAQSRAADAASAVEHEFGRRGFRAPVHFLAHPSAGARPA
jgi:galactokinase